ncbi:MAG: MBL fold metallo-hydrolase, partial [Shimia sp.]
GGVPRLGGHWGRCDPANPKNRRRRCSLLVEQQGPEGVTRVLIDTSPDMRGQLLDAGVGNLDGVVWTHPHADHVHGIDDLRMIVFNQRARLPVWADAETQDDLLARFGYAFVQPEGSSYPPILDLQLLDGPMEVPGAGGAIPFVPVRVQHGGISALGFRVGDVAYLPDVSSIPEEGFGALRDLDVWIVDALRRDPHPSHSHLANTLAWIERVSPKRAVLTNMHIDMDYAEVAAEVPNHVTPAFDGMVIEAS